MRGDTDQVSCARKIHVIALCAVDLANHLFAVILLGHLKRTIELFC